MSLCCLWILRLTTCVIYVEIKTFTLSVVYFQCFLSAPMHAGVPPFRAKNSKESISLRRLNPCHPNKLKSSAYSSRISCWLFLGV